MNKAEYLTRLDVIDFLSVHTVNRNNVLRFSLQMVLRTIKA